LNEKDRNAADDWIRDNMPDPDEYSLEDNEEEGDTQSYFFLRYRDSATIVYKVAVKDGKVSSVLQEFYYGEGSQEKSDERKWLVKPEGILKERPRVTLISRHFPKCFCRDFV